MLDAGGGGGAKQIKFVADTVSSGPAGSGLVASQTSFSVDPEQAQKLIDGLVEARDKLQQLNRDAFALQSIGSPGKDVYSGMAALAIQRAAGTDEGGYGWANKMAYEALNNTINNIQTSLDSYKAQDEATADAFKGEGK
ncbi:hypothetical protein ADK67_46240 [Saccharothrix sp. NRRL B-16348]|jgi:hypothetical protein|uniref:hypothetical protein n=1 Tax=Saccharothrix sp. NRRL B-16348 TaxID=1415542 RepID=UPI0006AE6CA7|nr:hypothetical protein [Saccharothrix sp. NRRL B-16348]KOX12934.1 hypothetical protein ADK67_46240 [Saccharothrix sp. NRRL B-16348]